MRTTQLSLPLDKPSPERPKGKLSGRAVEALQKVLQARFGGNIFNETPLDRARRAQQLSDELALWSWHMLQLHAQMVESRWESQRRRFFR